jgi:hypothetical protein
MKIIVLALCACFAAALIDRDALNDWYKDIPPLKVLTAINCGSDVDTTDIDHIDYSKDTGFSGGVTA